MGRPALTAIASRAFELSQEVLMSRRWLSLTLLFFSTCYRTNPDNCVATPGSCKSTEICLTSTERCIDPTTIACGSVDCPPGLVCDQSTLFCAFDQNLNILSIDKPYIKNDGGEVVVIKGTGFVEGSKVLFNGVEGLINSVTSTEIKVTTPSRPQGTPCGRLPLRVTNPNDVKKTVDAFWSYYSADADISASLLSSSLTLGAERLVLADLTRDGKNDLIATVTANRPTVLTGTAAGFEPGMAILATANATFAAADLGVGRSFVLTADRNNTNITVYKVNAGPVLSYAQINTIVTPAVESLSIVDLNADNEQDAIGLYASGQIVNLIHEGEWGRLKAMSAYSPMSLPMSKGQGLVAGIYYGNKPIIASINRTSQIVDLAEFSSTGNTFTNIGMLQSNANILDIFDGDFNGDGKKDLVVFNTSGSARIFYNDNGFSNSRIKDISFTLAITGATVGDLDCDGITDLIALNNVGAAPGVFFSTERSPNLAMFPLVNRDRPVAAAVGDIDGDLVPELVVYTSPTASLNRIGVIPRM